MKKLLLATSAIALLLTAASQAATDTSSQTATLTVSGECEVITAPIGATTSNFAAAAVTLQTTGDYTGSFSAVPTGSTAPSTSAGDTNNVSILCSAGGTTHGVSFSTSDTLSAGLNTIAWTASRNGTAFTPGVGTQTNSTTILANPIASTITEYKVTGSVAAQAIADSIAGSYQATVTVTVTY